MISQIKQKGFTIVELLIVIVVIAILAAISIAAYTNITARANTSNATAAAKAVRDVANAYYTANSAWPANKAQFVSGGTDAVSKLDTSITFASSVSASQASPKTVVVRPFGSPAAGFQVTYWDYSNGAAVITTVGDTTGALGTALTN